MTKRGTPWNPNTADWLVRQRGTRTQDAVIADMAARGVKVKRAWLSRIENGAPFSDELLAAFEDYYGSVPPPFEPVSKVTDSSLAAALSELAGELRAARLERARTQERLDALEPVVRRLAERVLGERQEPALHPQTTGSGQ